MRHRRYGAAWRAWLVVLALLCGVLLPGCSTTEAPRDDGTTMPWNTPEQWEREPNMKAPLSW
jgi:hypothetical protein